MPGNRVFTLPCCISINFVSKLFCALGCLCHFIVINDDYFKYETVAVYAPFIALYQKIPMISLCFVPFSPVDKNATFMEQSKPVLTLNPRVVVNVSASSVVTDCHMRNFTSRTMDYSSDCSTFFDASVAARRSFYTCYTLTVKEQYRFSPLELAAAMVDKFILYRLSLRDEFVDFNRMVFFNHHSSWPEDTFLYLIDIDATSADRKQASFLLVYWLINYKRLSAPYDTRCINKRPVLCRGGSIHPLCSRSLCNQFLGVTDIEKLKRSMRGFNIAVRGEAAPAQLVKYSPKTTATTFFIQACSIFGLWCSLSVSSIVLTSSNLYKRKSENLSRLIMMQYNLIARVSRTVGVNFASMKASVIRREEASRNHVTVATRLTRVLIKLIILGLFSRELTFLSIDYFKYATRTEIHLNKKVPLDMPGISYCVDLNEWYKVANPDYRVASYNRSMTEYVNKLNFTVRKILDSAVDSISAIKSCRVRAGLMSPLEKMSDCVNQFDVTKFYHNEMICYYFNPRVDYQLRVDNFRRNDSHPSIIYSIVLDEALAGLKHLQVIVSLNIPTFSRFLANRIYREHEKELIISSFVEYEHSNLPGPYDTMCDDSYNDDDCTIRCLNFSRINLAPYSEVHSLPLDLRLVDYNDMKNESLARFMKKAETKCAKVCHEPCQDSITKTIQHNGYSSDERLELALAVPKYPFYRFNAIPLYTPYTFIYQLACSASFWVGFSILAIINYSVEKDKADPAQFLCSLLVKMTEELEKVACSRLHLVARSANYKQQSRLMKLRRFLLPCVLTVAFFSHSFTTVANYFQYATLMDTRLYLQTDFHGLVTRLCISFDQLDLQNNYSVANIFQQSPRSEDVMLECGHRGFNLSELSKLPRVLKQRIMPHVNSSSRCSRLFRVRKMISLAMVCYRISPHKKMYEAEFNGKYHLNNIKLYQFFTLKRVFSKYNLTLAVSQNSGRVSLLLATMIEGCQELKNKWFWINYIKYDIDSLPYPYDTGIFDAITDIRCRRQCVSARTLNYYNLVSSYDEFDNTSLVHESPEQSSSLNISKIRAQCDGMCKQHKWTGRMKVGYFKTSYDGPYQDSQDKEENGTNGLWFRSSDYLVPHTNLYPALRLSDLVLRIGTIYSIWFGLSALQTADRILCISFTESAESLVTRQVIRKRLYALRVFSQHSVHR